MCLEVIKSDWREFLTPALVLFSKLNNDLLKHQLITVVAKVSSTAPEGINISDRITMPSGYKIIGFIVYSSWPWALDALNQTVLTELYCGIMPQLAQQPQMWRIQ